MGSDQKEKKMSAYYNEIDPYAAQWLRNLIAAGHIAPGEVDERSITDVNADDLRQFTQCHFFAGIGVWSYALRQSGWPDDRPVWTGSCPCQPFSAAGKGKGTEDERHLWPTWYKLIEQCRPSVVFGEQVEAAIRHGWLDLVQTDLEGIDYAVGAVGIPAAGVGAPHIRARLWFVADNNNKGLEGRREPECERAGERSFGASSMVGRVGHSYGNRRQTQSQDIRGHEHGMESQRRKQVAGIEASGDVSNELADAELQQRQSTAASGDEAERRQQEAAKVAGFRSDQRPRPTNGLWRDADWLYCRDGKWRPVEPGTFPLAHGTASRVGRLRAYGNAIVPQVAQEIITAYMECRP